MSMDTSHVDISKKKKGIWNAKNAAKSKEVNG